MPPDAKVERTCRVCGCTDDNACLDGGTGPACHWVEEDLCSACVATNAVDVHIEEAQFEAFVQAVADWNSVNPEAQIATRNNPTMKMVGFFCEYGFQAAMTVFGVREALAVALESTTPSPGELAPKILLPGRDF